MAGDPGRRKATVWWVLGLGTLTAGGITVAVLLARQRAATASPTGGGAPPAGGGTPSPTGVNIQVVPTSPRWQDLSSTLGTVSFTLVNQGSATGSCTVTVQGYAPGPTLLGETTVPTPVLAPGQTVNMNVVAFRLSPPLPSAIPLSDLSWQLKVAC